MLGTQGIVEVAAIVTTVTKLPIAKKVRKWQFEHYNRDDMVHNKSKSEKCASTSSICGHVLQYFYCYFQLEIEINKL